MRRRDLIMAVPGIAFAAPLGSAFAQPRPARVGWLSGGSDLSADRTIDVLKQTLHDLGWRLGANLDIEERRAYGTASNLRPLAAEAVAQRPHVLVCTGATEATALRAATRVIPIVFMQVAVDPVAAGLVESISRPGGNITGIMQAPQLLTGKRLDILTELLGRRPQRVGYMLNPASVNVAQAWTEAQESAAKVGTDLLRIEMTSPGELDSSFEALKDRDAVLVSHDFMFVSLSRRIADIAARLSIPVMFENSTHVVFGGLVSYGADLRENYRQGAIYVDRILRGARPIDLPIVQGNRLELVLNTKAARALGLTIPPTLLARADEVIE